MNVYLSAGYGLPNIIANRDEFPRVFRDHNRITREMIALIPKNASVTANRQAVTHLTHHENAVFIDFDIFRHDKRRKLYDLDIDYILLDTRSENDSRPSRFAVDELIKDSRYGLLTVKDGVYVFKKGHPYRFSLARLFKERGGAYTTPPEETHTIAGVRVKDAQGGVVSIEARPGSAEGALAFGPYMDLARGRYEGVFRLKVERTSEGPVARIDAACEQGKAIVAEKTLAPADFSEPGRWLDFHLPFRIDQGVMRDCELRVIYLGGAPLAYGGKTLRRP